MKTRCAWVNLENPLYIKYHDEEWGREVHDDSVLFEFLVLEGAQAGLNWETILKKREHYRKAFDNFDYKKIAAYSDRKIQELLQNEGIIRNKLKIKSAIKNAQVFIQIQQECWSFSQYLWNYVDGEQIQNHPTHSSEKATESELSKNISKDLKKRGMNFVGPTIMYAYLQAVWVIDDHIRECFLSKKWHQ